MGGGDDDGKDYPPPTLVAVAASSELEPVIPVGLGGGGGSQRLWPVATNSHLPSLPVVLSLSSYSSSSFSTGSCTDNNAAALEDAQPLIGGKGQKDQEQELDLELDQ